MVSVVIASFNRLDRLKVCLESVCASAPQPRGGIECIVVSSTYTTHEEQLEINAAGGTLVLLEKRTFVSEAHNRGVGLTRGDQLLFLDDDNVVAADAIARMSSALDKWDDAVLVGPVMYYGHEPERVWCAGVHRTRLLMRTRFRTTLPDPTPERIKSEDFPNCFMCRRSDFERVGGFDVGGYPMHMSESDFARRLSHSTGKGVYCVPASKVWHHIGASFSRRTHLVYRSELPEDANAKRAYWIGRSRALYAAQSGSLLQYLGFALLGQWIVAGVNLTALYLQSRSGRALQARSYLLGLAAGVRLGILTRMGSSIGRTS